MVAPKNKISTLSISLLNIDQFLQILHQQTL